MKVLIITAKLASNLVKKVSSKSNQDVHVYTVNTPIAAFLTPQKIIREVGKIDDELLESIDLILTPGLIRKDVDLVKEKTGIPTFKGPKDAADLKIVIDMIEKLDLSTKTPADKLIEDELRKKALEFIDNFENDIKNRKKLLKKPQNIKVGNLPVGEDFPMRVLAEIANAPLLTKQELIDRALYFVQNGAEMIDIGMVAGESLEDKIPSMVKVLKDKLGSVPISIDTLNPAEIEIAVKSGVDMVLSLDHGNYKEVLPLLEEHNTPAVLLPTDYKKSWVPETVEERVESLEYLRRKCKNIDVIADLILDPINSSSIVESIIAGYKFKQRNRDPLFFGIGNVTELLDADSVGVNALLSGIAMELGASILFTPEESGKTRGSVFELSVSSKMMFLAKHRGSIPKDLGINLLVFKDKRKEEKIIQDVEVKAIEGQLDSEFVHDPSGSFKIMIDSGRIKAVHYKNSTPNVAIVGFDAKQVFDEILKLNLVSRMEHAFYLGVELEKAEIALITQKSYVQDFDLFKRINLKYNNL
ncbi:MAG: dihydropteroate synthase-like protein [Methanomicrobiales archaeon]